MTGTEQLKEDHRLILSALGVLDVVAARIEAGSLPPPEHLGKLLRFLRVFADEYHHHKEEQSLFPAMEAAGLAREGGPIAVMRAEHETGRALTRGLFASAAELAVQSAQERFVAAARHYSAHLRQHMAKEDEILFHTAELQLGLVQNDTLYERFVSVEASRLPEGRPHWFRVVGELVAAYR